MNRIILIGNGFDLAHGIPTSYRDFINWYWNVWKNRLMSSPIYTIQDELCEFTLHKTGSTWLSFLYDKVSHINPPTGMELVDFLKQIPEVKVTSCKFLENICKSVETKGWVDIENEYYKLLISCSKNQTYDLNQHKLNRQIECLQNLLCEYLSMLPIREVMVKKIINDIIYEPFNPNDISISRQQDLKEHVNIGVNCSENAFVDKMQNYNIAESDSIKLFTYRNEKKNWELERMYKCYSGFFLPNNILLLNFNYTSTASKYVEKNNSIAQINHIHGELGVPDNIIFGYGDELDDNYRNISNLNDNEYLKNFKSIKYLESDRYRKALQFMEAAPYQVYIMGHSCGNSDRTFLNTLFEHKNCVSIKPYYYKKDDGTDNYLEIVQNISRNFTDMKLMRDRVVNKLYCGPFSS